MLQAMCSWDDSLTHNAIEVYISRFAQAPGCRNQDSHGARIWLHGPGSGCKLASAGISPTG